MESVLCEPTPPGCGAYIGVWLMYSVMFCGEILIFFLIPFIIIVVIVITLEILRIESRDLYKPSSYILSLSVDIEIFITLRFHLNYFVACICMGVRGHLAGLGSPLLPCGVPGITFRLSCLVAWVFITHQDARPSCQPSSGPSSSSYFCELGPCFVIQLVLWSVHMLAHLEFAM